ncbi:MAG: DMT family transporter [Leptolyngbyaceae cyanobacterium SM1_3_5]|nr:DMT family transporter [Leptolyngbyaceae cyanobacterium SM1_3_5]
MNTESSPRSGVLCAVVSAACFATIPLVSNIVYADGVRPITLLFFRFAIASICLSGWAIARRQRFPSQRNLLGSILLGVGFVLQSFCFFSSLLIISGSSATILLYLYPAFVVCILLLRGQSIDRPKAIALVLSLVGCYLVINPAIAAEGNRAWLGIGFAVGAAIANALYIVLSEPLLNREESIPAVAIMSGVAAFIYGTLNLATDFKFPSMVEGWLALAWIGVVCAALAIGLLFESVKLIGAANSAILSTLEPVMTLAIAVGVLGEAVTIEKLVGGAMIVGAAILIARRQC